MAHSSRPSGCFDQTSPIVPTADLEKVALAAEKLRRAATLVERLARGGCVDRGLLGEATNVATSSGAELAWSVFAYFSAVECGGVQ